MYYSRKLFYFPVLFNFAATVSLNRPADRTWRRPPGRPRNNWSVNSYETIPPVRLESSGGVLSTVDMVVQRRDGPRHWWCWHWCSGRVAQNGKGGPNWPELCIKTVIRLCTGISQNHHPCLLTLPFRGPVAIYLHWHISQCSRLSLWTGIRGSKVD